MAAAFDKETGVLKYVLDKSGKWVKPTIAENPETGERYYLEGDEWKTLPLSTAERGAGMAASVLQGPLMGFGDEFVATLENPIETARSTVTGEASPGYDASLERFRRTESRYRQAEPGTAFALTAGAGLVGGGAQLGKAAFGAAERLLPNAGRLAHAATTGAAFGGVAGFGSGEGGLADRLVSATFGAGTGAALGGALEFAAPVVSSLYRSARGNPSLTDATGNLNATGQQAAADAASRTAPEVRVDPSQWSAETSSEFSQLARNALNPEEALAVAEARSLPVRVDLTRGQSNLRPTDQMDETQLAKGVYGEQAAAPLRERFDLQQQQLRANVPEIAARVSGGQSQVSELGQGATAVQNTLSIAERAAKKVVDKRYDAARKGADAGVTQQALTKGIYDIEGAVYSRFDAEAVPHVARVLGGLRPTLAAEGQPQVLVSKLFEMRAKLVELQGAGGVEGKAAGAAKHALDRWFGKLAKDRSALAGDKGAIRRWRSAIHSRADYGARFENDDLVSALVERTRVGGQDQLRLDVNGAVNKIFGSAQTGWTKGKDFLRDLTAVRRELGDNSPSWHALREEAFLRFAKAGEGQMGPTGRSFSGANFAKEWGRALRENPEVMRVLFSDQERNLISQFSRVALRTTTNVKGGNNYSDSSAGMASIIRRMFASAFMGPKMAAFMSDLPVVKAISNLGYTIKAEGAVRNNLARGYRDVRPVKQAVERSSGPLAGALVQSVFGR